MEWLLVLGFFGVIAWQVWRVGSTPPALPDADPPAPEPPVPDPRAAMYLVLQGPDKGLLVRLDPFARLGGPGTEGTWVCVDVPGRVYVRVEGVDSQLGMVLLDLWALLGPDEARATLARPVRVLPDFRLHEVEAALGGFQAMEGWIQVPSLANFVAPTADELPETLHVSLQFPDCAVQMFMERARLLEVATRRTHPTASPRDARPQPRADRPQTPEEMVAVMASAMAQYQSRPACAVDLLEEAFGTGPLPELDPQLCAALAQVWGLALRNAGRFDEAVARFGEGLQRTDDDPARQELHYNRGYARLMGLMSARAAQGGELVRSTFQPTPDDAPALTACLEDFREAARLGPDDAHAHSQRSLSARLLAMLRPDDRSALLQEARAALDRAIALTSDPQARAALEHERDAVEE